MAWCLASIAVTLALAAPGFAGPRPATDPPFDASGHDAAEIAEIWSSRDDPDRRFESLEFPVPEVLALVVAGYPARQGVTLALEDATDGTTLTLDAPEAGYAWHVVRFSIPRSWVGRRARIVASAAGSPWWIGVTSPVRAPDPGISDLRIPLLAILCFALFLLPGFAVLSLADGTVEPWIRIALVVTASCLTGYAIFYLYFFSPALGIASSGLTLAGSAIALARGMRRAATRALFATRELCVPMALMLLYSLFAACLTFVHVPSWPDADEIPRNRYVRSLPGDNALPQFLAEKLWSGADARQVIDGWLSSDRPPLQTGLLLLQRPAAEALGASPSLYAQVAGMTFQSTWIAGIWVLCAAGRMRRTTMVIALAAGGMSGFFLLNTAFVWPKMLAGALGLIAVALMMVSSRDGWTRGRTALCATSACLALLAHTGAVFALVPAAMIFALGRSRPAIRDAALAIAIAGTLFVPWMLYQRLYAPPGNRLVMLHIAGAEESSTQTFTEAISANYRRLGAAKALRVRWENAQLLVPRLGASELASVESRRDAEWNRVFGTLGLLNLGWLLLLRRVVRRERAPEEIRRLYWVAGASFAFGIAVLFKPGLATAHVAAYTGIVTLVLLAANELATLPRAAIIAIVAAQSAIFVVDWIILTPPRLPASAIPVASMPLAATAIAAAIGFLALSAAIARAAEDAPATA